MTNYSVEQIRETIGQLKTVHPRTDAVNAASQILSDLADAKQKLNDKKKAYHASKKK